MNGRRRIILAVLLVAGAVGAYVTRGGAVLGHVPTTTVRRGDFVVTHLEAGEIRAARGEKISSPRVRGDLKIVHLWPEGERVEVGDLILQFDRSQHEEWLKDDAADLEQALSDSIRMTADMDRRRSELEMEVERAKASLELAQINLQKSAYGSPIEKEERQIALERAERALKQAHTDVEAQKIIDRVEMQNMKVRLLDRRQDYEEQLRDYERLTIYAQRPGLVVYEKIRKRGTDRQAKVMEGDVVWGGASLLSLPELEAMQVYSQVGEMDVHMVEVGQPAEIRLEAFPGPVFHGVVADIAPMANEMEGAPTVSVFEMLIDIEEQDDRLAPGMSASAKIVVDAASDVLIVPIGAVFHDDGRTVVYRQKPSGGFEQVEVQTGKDNGLEIVIESGLEEGDAIALEPPSSV